MKEYSKVVLSIDSRENFFFLKKIIIAVFVHLHFPTSHETSKRELHLNRYIRHNKSTRIVSALKMSTIEP